MAKLIIHETDSHGCGKFHYNGRTDWYSYDAEMGDIKGAVEALIDIGFIKAEDVLVFDDYNDIYKFINTILSKNT
jgi:hypothetical protein